MNLEDIHWELYDLLQKFEPFGQKNEEPKYLTYSLIHILFGSLLGPIMALGAMALWIVGRIKIRQALHGMNGRRAYRG